VASSFLIWDVGPGLAPGQGPPQGAALRSNWDTTESRAAIETAP
jgi:hypothetical protein